MMDTLSIVLPYSFVQKRVTLNWREISYAIEHQLISPNAAIEHAAIELAAAESDARPLLELASLGKNESVHPFLEQMAAAEPDLAIETIQEKWAYLVLAWVYEHRNDYSEPLAVVEEVYAYFDYPEKISAFVRYMPSEAADLGSLELNIARLYERWEAYLKEEAKEYESNKQNQGHF